MQPEEWEAQLQRVLATIRGGQTPKELAKTDTTSTAEVIKVGRPPLEAVPVGHHWKEIGTEPVAISGRLQFVTPYLLDLRQYLTSAYGDEELGTLCSDYFRDVYENFTVGMSKAQKIQLLLDHVSAATNSRICSPR